MARPAQADSAATRRRILATASLRFSSAGVNGCSMRAIAREVNVSVATIHHHFGSKEGLHTACLDAMYADLATLRDTLVPTIGSTNGNALEKVVRESWRFARNHRLQLRLLMREVVSRGGLDARRREEQLLPFLDQGSELLASQTGGEATSMRLVLQSAIHLVVRYALGNDEELEAFTGLATRQAEEAIEDHLVCVIGAMANPRLHP